MNYIDKKKVAERRNEVYRHVRELAYAGRNTENPFSVVGNGYVPALMAGTEEDVSFANEFLASPYFGRQDFEIFPSTMAATYLNKYDKVMTPAARSNVEKQALMCFRRFDGAAQPDYKFHGCNDNMPTMATKALILGGEVMNNPEAVEHGVWNLNELRRQLCRTAWISEFNSCTYSMITLAAVVTIAKFSKSEEIRKLARQIEVRIWADFMLHYHPSTKRHAGPQSRAYIHDRAGHSHSMQDILWMLFGSEYSGYDVVRTYFGERHPLENLHFKSSMKMIAGEFTFLMDGDYEIPEDLQELYIKKTYPAITKGRTECFCANGMSNEIHTTSYMEEDFSLGSANVILSNSSTTSAFFATYKHIDQVKTFFDSSSVFMRNVTKDYAGKELVYAVDGSGFEEASNFDHSYTYALQEKNSVIVLNSLPAYIAPLETDFIALEVCFPIHFRPLTTSTLAESSETVIPVSVESGKVYMFIRPLPLSAMSRKNAVEWLHSERYDILRIISYQGEKRTFSAEELAKIQNGLVFTIDSKSRWKSLEEFHAYHCKERLLDYWNQNHRYVRYKRQDVQFEICCTPVQFGIQTQAVNGRHVSQPLFETNQLDPMKLPFMTGPVEDDQPFFPWGSSLAIKRYPGTWLIGSTGLPGETPYADVVSDEFKPE